MARRKAAEKSQAKCGLESGGKDAPPDARQPWKIQEHPDVELRQHLGIRDDRRLVLGNKDRHYVWLKPA